MGFGACVSVHPSLFRAGKNGQRETPLRVWQRLLVGGGTAPSAPNTKRWQGLCTRQAPPRVQQHAGLEEAAAVLCRGAVAVAASTLPVALLCASPAPASMACAVCTPLLRPAPPLAGLCCLLPRSPLPSKAERQRSGRHGCALSTTLSVQHTLLG